MEYAIYSFGGGEILWQVLNGLALVFKSNNNYFTPVAKIAMVVGGLWAANKSLLNGQISLFAKDWFIPTFFLITLFFAPKSSVMIIDKVNPRSVVMKVDHVPAGVALIASTASTISMHLTELLEEKLTPLDADVGRYSKSGPMFAAHMLAASRDIRAIDANTRQNLKDFMNQCYLWPFILTNLAPGRAEAEKASNILEFVAKHAHPALGMYWREADGNAKFMYCKQCVAKVKTAVNLESRNGLAMLSSQLWGGSENKTTQLKMNRKLHSYMRDGWQFIGAGGKSVYDLVGQQMLINAYREGLDDKRESLQLSRINPKLISYSATRGSEQQNTGFLVSGAMAAKYLPSLQSVFFALLLIAFLLILPMSLLPGGLSFVSIWVKMVIWVQSWPVFFAILNAIGLMWLSKSGQAELLRGGEGLNILTQNGLSDAAWDSYCIVQNLFLTVPLLSWSILSKGGLALVSMAERMTPALGRALGPAIVDNTPSFDTQSFHNRTVGSMQLAQQQLAPATYAGSLVDDGRQMVRTATTGEQAITQHMSSLKTNIATSDNLETMYSQQAANEQQVQQHLSEQLSNTQTEVLSQSSDLIESWSQGSIYGSQYSETQNQAIQHSADKVMTALEHINQTESVSDGASFGYSGSAGVSTSKLALVGKVLDGLGFKMDANAVGQSRAERQDMMNKLQQYEVSQRDLDNISQGLQAVASNQASYNNDYTSREADNWRGAIDQAQTYSKQLSASKNKSQRYSQMASSMQRLSASLNTNINDDVLAVAANSRFAGDKASASSWARENPAAFNNVAQQYLSGWQAKADQLVSSNTKLNPENLSQAYQQYRQQVTNGKKSLAPLDAVHSKSDLSADWQHKAEMMHELQGKVTGRLAEYDTSQQQTMTDGRNKLLHKHSKQRKHTLAKRAFPRGK